MIGINLFLYLFWRLWRYLKPCYNTVGDGFNVHFPTGTMIRNIKLNKV